jgi:hypothetical protein
VNHKRFCSALTLALLLATPPVIAAKDKSSSNAGKVVDAGSFGVFVRGQRVATEKFQIEQGSDYSVDKSEFKADNAGEKASQSSELQIEANGDLRRYTWRSESPEKAEEVVEPSETFLVEHLTYDGNQKKQDIPFLLPHSTVILDDYFFSHREILVWRYIASACVVSPQEKGCRLEKAQFGALVPRQHISMPVTVEYAGKEKVTIKGVERELDRFNLHSEGEDWALYLAGPEDGHKLLRIVVAGAQTEILRD